MSEAPKIPEGQVTALSTHLEQYPRLKPFAGLVFEAYMSRTDVGSGLRVFIVSQVGHKWIHLFYGPQLHAFKLRPSEFAKIYMRPILDLNATSSMARIRAKVEQAQRFGYQYSQATVDRVLRLKLSNGLNAFIHAVRP